MNNMIVLNELESKLDTINSSLSGKIDTINTNSAAIKSVVDNIYSKVDTEIGTLLTNTNTNNTANATGTLSQKLSYVINNLLGTANATGGSSTSGSMMAKLNALLNLHTVSVTYTHDGRNNPVDYTDTFLSTIFTGTAYPVSLEVSAGKSGSSQYSYHFSYSLKDENGNEICSTSSTSTNSSPAYSKTTLGIPIYCKKINLYCYNNLESDLNRGMSCAVTVRYVTF